MGDNVVGKPEQRLIVRDPSFRSSAAIISATSEDGPRIGLVTPDEDNLGGLVPVVTGEPDRFTVDGLSLELVQGGGPGIGRWVYRPAASGTGWVGRHSDLYFWGVHSPTPTSNVSAILLYSSVFQRVIVVSVDLFSISSLVARWQDVNARPTRSADWEENEVFFSVKNGRNATNEALAGCELRDGSLLLAVRTRELSTVASDISSEGDIDLFRSVDGGETWSLTLERLFASIDLDAATLLDAGCLRMASSGDWVRLCFVEESGNIGTLVSSDGGQTWSQLEALEAGVDIEPLQTDQANDQRPYDLVAVDDSTGAFMLVTDPVASGMANRIKIYYATRADDFSSTTLLTGNINGVPRSYFAWRDQYYVWVGAITGTEGNTNDAWYFFRAPRTSALEPTSWEAFANVLPLQGAAALAPLSTRFVWCGDRLGILGYNQNVEGADPYTRTATCPWLMWGGGWSTRPSFSDYRLAELAEVFHWTANQGEPAGGATGSTNSLWTSTVASGGTHAWNAAQYVTTDVDGASQVARFELLMTPGASDEPPQWDPPAASEDLYQLHRVWMLEWVMACGVTAAFSGGSGIAVGVLAPAVETPGGAWSLTVRHGADRIVVFDGLRAAPLTTLMADLDTGDETVFHRIRLVVHPAATPGTPKGILMHRRDDGDVWTESAVFDLGVALGSAATQWQYQFGALSYTASAGLQRGYWREIRQFGQRVAPQYADPTGWNSPQELPGAFVSIYPLGLTAGSTATTNLVAPLRVSWGGVGGAVGDSWTANLRYDYPAEALVIDSPRTVYRTVAGVTAGAEVVFDACEGGADDGRRWVHSDIAFFGALQRRTRITYSDDAAGVVNAVVAATLNGTQYQGVYLSAVSGSVLTLSAAGTPNAQIRGGELAGRYLTVTASSTLGIGQVHKIDQHVWDGANHYLTLAQGGQFGFALAAGDTVAIWSDRVAANYGQTIVRRYMTAEFGLTGENSFDGRWGGGTLVPGVGVSMAGTINWSQTDEELPTTMQHRTRGGQSWAYEEAPPARRLSLRLLGDASDLRAVLRDLIGKVAKYQAEPVALISNAEHQADQNRALFLGRWANGSRFDQRAWYRDEAGVLRQAGDLEIVLDEVT